MTHVQKQQKSLFNMIYGWGKFGISIEDNDLFQSFAFKSELRDLELAKEWDKAEQENKEAEEECAEVLARPFRQEVQYDEFIEAWSTYQIDSYMKCQN